MIQNPDREGARTGKQSGLELRSGSALESYQLIEASRSFYEEMMTAWGNEGDIGDERRQVLCDRRRTEGD